MADNENLGAPQSRNEALLMNMLGESYDIGEPQSRIEALLMKIIEQGGGGGGDAQKWTETTVSTAGAVTQALAPYTIYHFTGEITSLTITLTPPEDGELAHYHFDFISGATAPTLTMPNSVTMPDSFSVEATKRYEVDVLNNYGTVTSWTES